MAWILISPELRCSGRAASPHGTGLALPLKQLGWDWGVHPRSSLQRTSRRSLIPPWGGGLHICSDQLLAG